MLIYSVLTLVVLLLIQDGEISLLRPVLGRVGIAVATLLLWRIYLLHPRHYIYVVRVAFQLALLGFWYPDIYYFARLMPNCDHVFAALDQGLFGCQPALEFARALSSRLWSELFYMGYFSYYLMLVALMAVSLGAGRRRFNSNANIVLLSFFVFYLVFLFLQVAGPQFYFPAVGVEKIEAGVFPPVYDYFAHHAELHHSEPTGLFMSLVQGAQGSERPIAAFPSSHVGVSTIFMILAYRTSKPLFGVFIPFYLLLVCSTVYIQAHYAVDVIAGLIAGLLVYQAAHKLGHHSFLSLPATYPHSRGRHRRHHHAQA